MGVNERRDKRMPRETPDHTKVCHITKKQNDVDNMRTLNAVVRCLEYSYFFLDACRLPCLCLLIELGASESEVINRIKPI
jgi:hypothetical protein